MGNSEDFAYAYGWNFYYERILGICPKKDESFVAAQRAWFWALLMIICIWIPQTASLSFPWGDLNSMIDCVSTNMSVAISIAKIMALQYQRKAISSILIRIADDWLSLRSNEEKKIMFETAKIGRKISMISVSITNIMFFVYIFSKVWSNIVRAKDSKINPHLSSGFLYDSYFPFSTTDYVTFVPIWLGQFFGTLLSMISYSGPDCIFSMMVLHLCGQLRIVRHSLKNLVNKTTIRKPIVYWTNLTAIVKRHEQLNELSFLIRDTLSSILLIQMLVCSLTFCFHGYAMFTTLLDRNGAPLPLHNLAFNCVYAGSTIIHLFIYCYVGDRLLVESTKITDDFYETAWYSLAPREAKAFLFVCHRSKIPLKLMAGKFCTFNLQLFKDVMKTSMGYLSLLMAMKERLIN